MTIIRVEKNRNYTTMCNYHLRDKNLSYKAKGLLSYMLSLQDNWDYSVSGLTVVSKESAKAIRSTLKELEDNYYLVRNKIQLENGRLQINTNNKNTNYKDKIDKTINSIIKELINK